MTNLDLERRRRRDAEAASTIITMASVQASDVPTVQVSNGFTDGRQAAVAVRRAYEASSRAGFDRMAQVPFHAMLEATFEYEDDSVKDFVLYANKDINTPATFKASDGRTIQVLSWTHPAIVRGLTERLGTTVDVDDNRYRLEAVNPRARAIFDAVTPEIAGLYEPGGRVAPLKAPAPAVRTGIKAVKLGMTAEQGRAFSARPTGVLFLGGAPGSGKTTVALQRSRFLINEQAGDGSPFYTPQSTRIFLPNQDLIRQSLALLQSELGLPPDALLYVSTYVSTLLDRLWGIRRGARPRQRRLDAIEAAAYRAFYGLCPPDYLPALWQTMEQQALEGLARAAKAPWSGLNETTALLAASIVSFAHTREQRPRSLDPQSSDVTMDGLFQHARRAYEAARASFRAAAREKFDAEFAAWLFEVWDPVACVRTFLLSRRHEGRLRINDGTGMRADARAVMKELMAELDDRVWGPEIAPWLAWLLRFCVPSESEAGERFRAVPSSADPLTQDVIGPWPHVIIDEGQDLSVAEASLLCSRVHPQGALTIAADFRQVVSPVHGMTDATAFKIGCPLRDRSEDKSSALTQNKRQSARIAGFLMAAYQEIFREPAPFIVDETLDDGVPPRVQTSPPSEWANRIRQITNVLRRSPAIQSIALLQVNEEPELLERLRGELERLGVPLAPAWTAEGEGLITTSVERIKGLEYDACILLGVDQVERSSLKHTENRLYVGLSRATRRLILLGERFPTLLRRVDPSLYERVDG